MSSVKPIRRLSSGILKMLRSWSSMMSSGLGRRRQHELAARLLDRLFRGLARRVDVHRHRDLELATARQRLDRALRAHETVLLEPVPVDDGARAQLREPADREHRVL